MSSSVYIDRNIKLMNDLTGYDIVIVSTCDPEQEEFWQKRLESTKGNILPKHSRIFAVHEDWPGGAGNGLGTLYALQKAQNKAMSIPGSPFDLIGEMSSGKSVALYHTAGKGTRLAPLPGSENNNKPGVKLPALVQIGDEHFSMTILESVIKQTGVYASSRGGRISVFWGDQVFIPSVSVKYEPKHHVDILCKLGPMMTASEWEEKGMHKYGLIAVNKSNNAAQVEKVTHAEATKLLSSLGDLSSVGVSLGSFSMSAAFTIALMKNYADELSSRKGKLDTDPHFWMPLSLSLESYISIMGSKRVSAEIATNQHNRMSAFIEPFLKDKHLGIFGAIDVGSDCYWWDYGQLLLYKKNNMMMCSDSVEAKAIRQFFEISTKTVHSKISDGAKYCSDSIIIGSLVGKSSNITNSVVSRVHVLELNVQDSLLVNVSARRVTGKNLILYNVADDSAEGLELDDGAVLAHIYLPGGEKIKVESRLSIDGGKEWSNKVLSNSQSFEDIHSLNMDSDLTETAKSLNADHSKVRKELERKSDETHDIVGIEI